MRFLALIVLAMVMSKYRSGINSAIDTKQRHADAVEIVIGKRPEAAMRVAVLGTNSRMHDQGPILRNREDLFFQNELATRNHEIGRRLANKFPSCRRIWR